MSTPSLTLVLDYSNGQVGRVAADARELHQDIQAVSSEIDSLQNRVDEIAIGVGVEVPRGELEPPGPPPSPDATESPSWDDLVRRANQSGYGSFPDIDALLDAEVVAEIDQLHGGTFDGKVTLDGYDIAAAVMAGVTGAFTDLLVVGIPTGGMWKGEWQSGSKLTFALRQGALDNDNWLSGMVKVPFDRVNDTGIAGMGPRSHRVQTFGHDPLLGWALGTMDIMRGTLTGVDTTSVVHVVEIGGSTPGLLAALGLQAGHLLSDVVTRMGLPLPGWTALLTVPFGAIGPDERTVGELARWMYLRGYGTWHLATMATSVGVTEAVVRAYYAMRQLVDTDYQHRVSIEAAAAQASRVTDEPRYRSLSLLAHCIATAGNAGKLVLAGGNPLAINIAQWAVLGRKMVQRLQTPAVGNPLVAQHAVNVTTIETGWGVLGLDLSSNLDV